MKRRTPHIRIAPAEALLPSRALIAICAVLLVASAFAVYGNSLTNDYVWDDKDLVARNPDIRQVSAKNINTIFTHDILYFAERSNFYRPLQSFSYMIDSAAWGARPGTFRAVNILIHAANGIIIFFLLNAILRNISASFFSALLFVVHPVNTSAVAYISGRADLLALFFLLAACLFLLRFKKMQTAAATAVIAALFVLSLLSKEICLVFPVVAFVLLRYAPDDNGHSISPRERSFLAMLFIIAVLYITLRLTVLKFAPVSSLAINAPSLARRLMALPEVVFTYLRLIVLPYDLRMDRDITMPASFFTSAVLVPALMLTVLGAFFFKYIRKEKTAMLGLTWLAVFLIPSLNIVLPLNAPLSEHWLYIPFFGISIICGRLLLPQVTRPGFSKTVTYSCLLALIILYGSTTIYLNTRWADEKTLFAHIGKYKNVNPRAHYYLGGRYLDERKYTEAAVEFQKALDSGSRDQDTIGALAIALVHTGDREAAARHFNEAISIDPRSNKLRLLFAQALEDVGRLDDAIEIYASALQLDNKEMAAYNNLGVVYAKKKLYDKAREIWMQGLAVAPDSPQIRKNLEKLTATAPQSALDKHMANIQKLASEGQYAMAIEESRKALATDENNVGLHNNLGVLYSLAGDDQSAVIEFKKILELNPQESGAYKNIAIIFAKYPENYAEAIGYFERYLAFCSSNEERTPVLQKIDELKKKMAAQ